MKKCLVTLLLAFAVLGCTVPLAVAAPLPQGSQSLYTRLGSYHALVAVTKDFMGRLATDPSLATRLGGLKTAMTTPMAWR